MSALDPLGQALQRVRSATQPRKLALLYPGPDGREREASYGELWDQAARLRALFASRGLTPGARVLIASDDDAAVAAFALACLEGGYCAVVVDPDSTPAEAAILGAIAEPALVAADRGRLAAWGEGPSLPIEREPRTGRLFKRLLGRRGAAAQPAQDAFPAALAAHEPAAEPAAVDPEAEAYVLFTSGSTARPKGVRISRRALAAHAGTLARQLGYDAESRLLNVLPLHHADGLMHGLLTPLLAGATALRPLRLRLDTTPALLDAVYRLRATHAVVVPTILAFMERLGADYADAFRTPDLRAVISTAGALSPELWARVEAQFGVRVSNLYGLSETTTGGLFCGPDDASYRRDTVGRPLDCAIRVVGADGQDAPPGERGELWLQGELLFSGYLGEDRAPLVDGWFPTGDLVTRDADGFVRIVGRTSNLVISGGFNVQPEEVAEVVEALPAVNEAAAFGVPHEAFGEALVLCYVPAAETSPEAILAACRERLSDYKLPRELVALPALPRGPSGKVDLPALRALFARSQARQAAHGGASVAEDVKAAASRVFHLPPAQLTDDAGPGVTRGWDSFAHLSFVVELERVFDLRLETADVIAIRSLGDAVRAIERRLARP